MVAALALLVAIAYARSAFADDAWWLSPGGVSYHNDRSKHFNEFNFGLAVEKAVDGDAAVQVGAYRDSFYEPAAFGAVLYRPFRYQPTDTLRVSLGGAAGVAFGYPDWIVHVGHYTRAMKFLPFVFPLADFEFNGKFALMLSGLPVGKNGLVFLEFKFAL